MSDAQTQNQAAIRVVLVYGPGSGLGKSTLAKSVTRQLVAQGRVVWLLEEDAVSDHPAFRAYIQQVKVGHAGDVATLLEACRQFILELTRQPPGIVILDSLLPCWDWLFTAGCADTVVSNFTEDLAAQLSPLNPLLVFVEGDLDIALSRAVQDRGEDWALELAEARTGQRYIKALREYFRHLREAAERMFPIWRHPVVRVNTGQADLSSCTSQVVMAISRSETLDS